MHRMWLIMETPDGLLLVHTTTNPFYGNMVEAVRPYVRNMGPESSGNGLSVASVLKKTSDASGNN